jgi:hypothetical protein
VYPGSWFVSAISMMLDSVKRVLAAVDAAVRLTETIWVVVVGCCTGLAMDAGLLERRCRGVCLDIR